MPISFLTCLERDLIYARWWGIVDAHARIDNFENYLCDLYYRPGRTELIDLSRVELADWELGKLQSFLRRVNAQEPGHRIQTRTVVWAPTDDAYGTARMYQTLADMAGGIVIELHRSEQDALVSLGLPYPTIDELLQKERFLPHEKRPLKQSSA